MNFDTVETLFRHPSELSERERELIEFVLYLKDSFGLDDADDECYLDLKGERDDLERNVEHFENKNYQLERIIDVQEEKIVALMKYVDDLCILGTAKDFISQHPLWKENGL